MNTTGKRCPYVCGPPLGSLPVEVRPTVASLYESFADTCEEIHGIRGFLPHEHFTEKLQTKKRSAKNKTKKPARAPSMDELVRHQISRSTNLMIVIALNTCWPGIEVEIAKQSGVPAIVFLDENKRAPEMLIGNPAVLKVIRYRHDREAQRKLADFLETNPALFNN